VGAPVWPNMPNMLKSASASDSDWTSKLFRDDSLTYHMYCTVSSVELDIINQSCYFNHLFIWCVVLLHV